MEGKMPYDAVTHTMELAMNWFVVKVLKACLHLRSFHLVTGIIVTRSENTMLGFTNWRVRGKLELPINIFAASAKVMDVSLRIS